MSPIRFVMIGGFLGAGKTTTIARLARHYQAQGKRVGIVTNDQATDLVDTQLLRSQGFDVGEVAGSCFCCNFDSLTDAAQSLERWERPDVILAEPVGSCTDLVATVIQPLKSLFQTKFDVAPYGVILKPSHGRKILSQNERGFSPQAQYIFTKQLEEADFIILNRIDELNSDEQTELRTLLAQAAPGCPIIGCSAKTGEGFDSLTAFIEQSGDFGRRILDIDYDTYAAGEAELGWLNLSGELTATNPFDLDHLLMSLVSKLRTSLMDGQAETAHLKVIGIANGQTAVVNLISNELKPVLSLPSQCSTSIADLVVNARVGMDPKQLTDVVKAAMAEVAEQFGAAISIRQVQSFRPGRPVPTHRITTPV